MGVRVGCTLDKRSRQVLAKVVPDIVLSYAEKDRQRAVDVDPFAPLAGDLGTRKQSPSSDPPPPLMPRDAIPQHIPTRKVGQWDDALQPLAKPLSNSD